MVGRVSSSIDDNAVVGDMPGNMLDLLLKGMDYVLECLRDQEIRIAQENQDEQRDSSPSTGSAGNSATETHSNQPDSPTNRHEIAPEPRQSAYSIASTMSGLLLDDDREKLMETIQQTRKLWKCDKPTGNNECYYRCISCLQNLAHKVKLHEVEMMLATEAARLERLSGMLKKILAYIPPPRQTRRALLEDSVLGVCEMAVSSDINGQQLGVTRKFEVACCIIDTCSNWNMGIKMIEFGKMISKTGGCQTWMYPNDWGISAKPPDIYGIRFKKGISSYFGIHNDDTSSEEELRWGCSPLYPKYWECKPPIRVATPEEPVVACTLTRIRVRATGRVHPDLH